MDTYQTKQEPTLVAGTTYSIKSLKDRNQFSDPNGTAEAIGISSAMWPISGMLWPSGIVLAEIISKLPLENLRILEVGCGIGLASMVAASKGADITACDYHPITPALLEDNTVINNLPTINYFHGDWRKPITNKGVFDLIIGSDLLYDRGHFEDLATFISCHLSPNGQMVLIDPKRRSANKFIKVMEKLQMGCTTKDHISKPINGDFFRYKSHTFQWQKCLN